MDENHSKNIEQKVRKYLLKIYNNEKDQKYLLSDDFNNELLDIIDEVKNSFNGNFKKWKHYQKELEKGHQIWTILHNE